jgi:hypothetical protein
MFLRSFLLSNFGITFRESICTLIKPSLSDLLPKVVEASVTVLTAHSTAFVYDLANVANIQVYHIFSFLFDK